MKYLLFAFPLFFYYELLGRAILAAFKKPALEISFGVGLVTMMAVLYVLGWPLSAFGAPSIAYVTLVLLVFLLGAYLIFKYRSKLIWHFDLKLWLIFGLLLAFEIYMSMTRTLGEPHGFDAVYYINYLSSNVDTPQLNMVNPLFGTSPNTFETRITYYFQSFNYFIPALVYILQKLFGLLGKTVDFLPTYVWTFQILLHMLFISVSLLAIRELKINNKLLKAALICLLILFLNNLYYNNAYGFIGNSYRMSIHALATLFLFRYFKEADRTYFSLFLLMMVGLCGFSSTGTFALIFVLYALFFWQFDKEPQLFKYDACALVVPCINILCVKFGVEWTIALATIALFVLIYLLNDKLLQLFQWRALRIAALVAIPLFTIAMSLFVTTKPSLFYGFLNNYSEFQDMSWDYFSFHDYRHWIFNLLVLLPLGFYIIKNPKQPFAIMALVLIFTVFNPLGANFMNTINWVYYRTYDLLINQFTLAFLLSYIVEKISYQKAASMVVLVLAIIMAVTEIPRYYHEEFKPDDDYNAIYKIQNSELEMINNVRQLIADKGLKQPKIINSTFYMNSFISDGIYLIGKEKRFNVDHFEQSLYDLYTIVCPRDGWDNFVPKDEPMYDILLRLLKESDYDILVAEYGYYIPYRGKYMSIVEAITSDGTYSDSAYSTAKYAVIDLKP